MANRFLLQSGGGVITLQSGGGNLLLQSDGATAGLDGGEDAGWLGLPGVILGAVALAGVIASGAAQAQTRHHQDEVPYATGNGIIYGQPYTSRAQVKPVFIQWGQGDELPTPVAPPALEESVFTPSVSASDPIIWLPPPEDHVSPKLPEEDAFLPFTVKNEVSFSANWPDETISRIQVEESDWAPVWSIPQISVTPVWDYQDEISVTPVGSIVEEPEFLGGTSVPGPSLSIWQSQDEIATAPAAFSPTEEDWSFSRLLRDDVSGIIWVTDDDIAPAFAVEEIGWKAEWLIPKPFTEVFWTTDEIPTATAQPQGGGGVVYDEISIFRWYQEDPLPILAATLGVDEEPWKAPVTSLEGPKWLDSPDELIVPQPTPLQIEEDKWLPHEFPNRQPSAEGIIWATDEDQLPFPAETEQWPYVQPAFPGMPWTGVFAANDDIVPQPPTAISVEETYWLQPDPPRDVVTGWQFPLDINEDFPELSTPPTPPRVEILGGDPTPKRKKHRKEVISELVDEVVRDRTSPAPKPVSETKVLVPSKTLVVVPELKPVIQVLPLDAPKPPADLSDDEIYALYLLGVL